MVDQLEQALNKIGEYLGRAVAAQPKLTPDDIDSKELCIQLAEQIRLQQYSWADSKYLPHVLAVHILEDKADRVESLEIIFCSPEFGRLLAEAAKAAGLEVLLPMRSEVELVKPDHPALIGDSRRCTVTLIWPKDDDSLAIADVVVDQAQYRIVSIKVRRSNMPVLARLTALNAEVYRNNYLLIREVTHIGRLRVVLDDNTGLFLRRNDFIFAQNDDPEAICNSVSRQQAKLLYHPDGYYVEDCGSANSTRIERIKGKEEKNFIESKPGVPLRLEHGDILHFGLAQVRFYIVEQIDPMLLAELSAEQERVSPRRHGERPQRATIKLPVSKRKE